jgi:hypothetical protein
LGRRPKDSEDRYDGLDALSVPAAQALRPRASVVAVLPSHDNRAKESDKWKRLSFVTLLVTDGTFL